MFSADKCCLIVFGPFVPQVGSTSPSGQVVRYGEIEDLKAAFEADGERIAAFMIEPIQGAAGYALPYSLPKA